MCPLSIPSTAGGHGEDRANVDTVLNRANSTRLHGMVMPHRLPFSSKCGDGQARLALPSQTIEEEQPALSRLAAVSPLKQDSYPQCGSRSMFMSSPALEFDRNV